MLNRIGAVAASATLITVGTFALSGAALLRSDSNLSASKVDYGQEHSSMSSLSDRSNLNVPVSSSAIADFGSKLNLQQPKAFFCWYSPRCNPLRY